MDPRFVGRCLLSDLTHPGQAQPPPSIEVLLDPDDTYGYAGVLKLRGEHDLSTAVEIQEAVDSICGNLLVDLRECGFMDSTVISVLIRDYQARSREGHDLELLAPLENTTIIRTLEITGMRDALVIHSSQPDLRPGFPAAS
jgi:anti-anti-sigma factor